VEKKEGHGGKGNIRRGGTCCTSQGGGKKGGYQKVVGTVLKKKGDERNPKPKKKNSRRSSTLGDYWLEVVRRPKWEGEKQYQNLQGHSTQWEEPGELVVRA